MPDVSLYMAFAAGLISFLSPCVLPLVPGYISFISGVSFAELKEKSGRPSFPGSQKRMIMIFTNKLVLIQSWLPFLNRFAL